MRLLLDTHILLWALTDDARFSVQARDLIMDPHNDVFFSVASVWEIAIKRSLPRGNMPVSSKQAVSMFRDAGYEELGISTTHVAMVEELPPLHADPFDRMLVAQALAEPMRLLTHDRIIASYSGNIILC